MNEAITAQLAQYELELKRAEAQVYRLQGAIAALKELLKLEPEE